MHRYRVQFVPKAGRFPLLQTLLVEADSREGAVLIAAGRCVNSKVILAEDVRNCRETPRGLPQVVATDTGLRLFASA